MNLKHVALYTKFHYEHGDDVWDDITKCLQADDYTPDSKGDILSIIINNVAPLFKMEIHYYTLEIIEALDRLNCWKFGYYTQDHKWAVNKWPELQLKVYDYQEAVLWFFLSKLQRSKVSELDGLPKADPNVLSLRNHDVVGTLKN